LHQLHKQVVNFALAEIELDIEQVVVGKFEVEQAVVEDIETVEQKIEQIVEWEIVEDIEQVVVQVWGAQ